MKVNRGLFVIALLGFALCAPAGPDKAAFDKMNVSLSFKDDDMMTACQKISDASGVPVNLEVSSEVPVAGGITDEARKKAREAQGIPNAAHPSKTLTSVLDAVCAADARYVWVFDEVNGCVNVHPKAKSDLAFNIDNISFSNRTLKEINMLDYLKLRVNKVVLTGDVPPGLTTKIFSINESNVSAERALNRLFAGVNPVVRWTAVPATVEGEDIKVLVTITAVVKK